MRDGKDGKYVSGKTGREDGRGGELLMDLKIRESLMRRAGVLDQELENRPWAAERMRERVSDRIKEERHMRFSRKNVKRLAVVFAAMCVLGSAAVMAAGEFVSMRGYSDLREEINSYDELEGMARDYGVPFEVKAPEVFSNGFAFDGAVPVHSSGSDGEGNETVLPAEVSVTYKKSGMADVTLVEAKITAGDQSYGDAAAHTVGETTFYYKMDHYRFVPPTYELSEEEQRMSDAGELIVSYGSDEVTDNQVSSVMWNDGGVSYQLLAFDTSLTEQEMVDMAAEVMGQ